VANPMYAQPQPPQTRPTVVTVSSYLLYLTAALRLISAVVSLTTINTISDVYRDAYSGTTGEGTEAVIVASTIVTVVVSILFAAGLAVLAIYNNRGRQAARVTTWVIGGVLVCCSGIGAVGTAATSSMTFDTGNGPSASDVQRRLSDALPSWYTPTSVTLSVISLLAVLAAIILLALPASNAFFRRPAQAGWDPSMPYPPPPPPHPGQPPYPAPQYPGQQQQPGQPQYPSQPQYPGQASYPGQAPYPGGQPPYPGQAPQYPPPPPPPPSGDNPQERPPEG
jgi:hypothetical protein